MVLQESWWIFMKRQFNCFDMIVGRVVHSIESEVNKKKELFLIDKCELIDKAIEEFNMVSIEAYVNKITKDIVIKLICSEFETNSEHIWFYDLLGNTDMLHMKTYDDEIFEFEFIYDGIWEEDNE